MCMCANEHVQLIDNVLLQKIILLHFFHFNDVT